MCVRNKINTVMSKDALATQFANPNCDNTIPEASEMTAINRTNALRIKTLPYITGNDTFRSQVPSLFSASYKQARAGFAAILCPRTPES